MRTLSSISLLLSLFTLGCTSGGSIGADGRVSGIVASAEPEAALPPPGEIGVYWSVSSGSPDYGYFAGAGAFSPAGFELRLADPLPIEAQNDYGRGARLGVGTVFAFREGAAPAVGRDTTDAEDPSELGVLGAADRFAIIYRAGEFPLDGSGASHWAADFPEGYSCGRGVEATAGETFDSFEPVDCDLVELKMGDVDSDAFDFVNWT